MNGKVYRKIFIIALLLCISTFCGCACGAGKYISKAHTLYNKETKDAPGAIEALNFALKKDPKNIEALTFLARIQFETKSYDDAITTYEKMLSLVPTDIQTHMNIAKALKEKGTFDKAIEHLKKVKEINPGGKLAQEADKLIPECESGKSSGQGTQVAGKQPQGAQNKGPNSPDDKNNKPQQPKKPRATDF